MRFAKCPGNLGFSEPSPADVACVACGVEAEIWSDEATARCESCGRIVIRTDTQSCVDWCRYAKECLGEEGYREYGEMKAAVRKASLSQAVEERLGKEDDNDIAPNRTALRFSEQLCSQIEAVDPMVVTAAILLLPLQRAGVANAGDGSYAKTAAAGIEDILRGMHYTAEGIRHVVAIQQDVMTEPIADSAFANSIEHDVVHDALLLASLEMPSAMAAPPTPERIRRICLTDEGKTIAVELRRIVPAPNAVELKESPA